MQEQGKQHEPAVEVPSVFSGRYPCARRRHPTRRVSRTRRNFRSPRDTKEGSLVVAKTGMGSSAALVSSLVGAILSFFGAARLPCFDDIPDQTSSLEEDVPGVEESLDLTHNLAQACHCVAQGKVS